MSAVGSVDQLIFTSCRYAIGGGSGFQVKSHSPGIRSEDVPEIVRHSDYQRPIDRQTFQELPSDRHPIGLRWYRLPSGAWALTRVVDAGVDHSSRLGNVFAHSLVFGEAASGRVDPVAWFGWTGWRSGLLPGEDDSPQVAHLAPVPPSAACYSVGDRTINTSRAREKLEALLIGLFVAQERNQLLVGRVDADSNVAWLALIARCLPAAILRRTEFSSFESSLRRAPRISMVADGGDVDFASGRKGGLFVGVDLAGPWCQEVWPETALVQAGRSFARATAAILFEQPALTSKFRAHMDAFAGQTLNADLGAAADLFLLNADTTTRPSETAIPALARLVLRSKSASRLTAMAGGLVEPLRARAAGGDLEAFGLLIEALVAQAREGCDRSERSDSRRAVETWFAFFLASLPEWPAFADVVVSAQKVLESGLPDSFRQLLLELVRQDGGAAVTAAIGGSSVEGAAELVELVIDLLTELHEPEPVGSLDVERLMRELRRNGRQLKEKLLAVVLAHHAEETRATLLNMAADPGEDGELPEDLKVVGDVTASVLEGMTSAAAASLQSQLQGYLIAAAWRARLAGERPDRVYRQLAPMLNEAGPPFSPAERLALALDAIRAVERLDGVENLFAVVQDLARRDLFQGLPQADRRRCVIRLSESLTIGVQPSLSWQVDLVAVQADNADMALSPARAGLHRRLRQAEAGNSLSNGDLEFIASELDGLPPLERDVLAGRLLLAAFRNLGSRIDTKLHECLMAGSLVGLGHNGEVHRRVLEQLVDEKESRALIMALHWWLTDVGSTVPAASQFWRKIVGDLAVACVALDAEFKVRPIEEEFITRRLNWTINQNRYNDWRSEYDRHRQNPLGQALNMVGRVVGALGRKPQSRP